MSNHVSTLKALPAVGAFPVDCIHPHREEADFETTAMHYINAHRMC